MRNSMGKIIQALMMVLFLSLAIVKNHQLIDSINDLKIANSKLSMLSEMAKDPTRHKELILVLNHNFYVVKNGVVVEHDKDWR